MPTTGNLVGSVPQLLQFDSGFLPAQPTTQIQYQANLASYPLTSAHDTGHPRLGIAQPRRLHRRSDGRRHRHRDCQRPRHVLRKFDQRRRHHRLRHLGLAGEHAAALGQDRQRRSPAAPIPGICSIKPTRPPPAPQSAWQNAGIDYTFARQRPDVAGGPDRDADRRDRRRRLARQRRASARLGRPHPVRRRQRQRAGQYAPAERLSGRHPAVGVGQRQGPRGRHLFEQPHHRSRRRSRWPISTASTASSASTAARSLRPTSPARRPTTRPARSSAPRSKAPTPTSPTNSPS